MEVFMKKQLLLPMCLFPVLATAHPGHDHTADTSTLLHTLMFISILAVAAVGIKFYQNKKTKTKKDHNGDQ